MEKPNGFSGVFFGRNLKLKFWEWRIPIHCKLLHRKGLNNGKEAGMFFVWRLRMQIQAVS